MGGSTSRNRSISAAEVRRVSPIRMLPWVSAPIAASTCEGCSLLALQAEPLATAKPALSSSSGERLAVDVEGREGQQVRQPVHRVARDVHVRHPSGDLAPQPVHQRALSVAHGVGPAAASCPEPPRPRGWPAHPAAPASARPGSRRSGNGARQRTPFLITRMPHETGPPYAPAQPVSTDQPGV